MKNIVEAVLRTCFSFLLVSILSSLTGCSKSDSPTSNQGTDTTGTPTKDATVPTLSLSALAIDGTYSVTWTGVANAISYELQEDENSFFTSNYAVYRGMNLSTSFQNKPFGKVYYYRVRSVTGTTTNGWSETKAIATLIPDLTGTWLPVAGTYDNAITQFTVNIVQSGTALSLTGTVIVRSNPLPNHLFPLSGSGTYSCPTFSISTRYEPPNPYPSSAGIKITGSVQAKNSLLVSISGTLYGTDITGNVYTAGINFNGVTFIKQ